MEETIRFAVEDKDDNAVTADLVLDSTKEIVELRMKNKKVFVAEWSELRKVFKRTFEIWDTPNEE